MSHRPARDPLGVDPKANDDLSTAILKMKQQPNHLVVTDGTYDNSVVALSNNAMDTLQFKRGDVVLVKGRKRKNTVLIVLEDDELDDRSAGINRVVRQNLRVKHDDIISIHSYADIAYVNY